MELRHGKAFEKNYDSFRQAGIHKDNERVFNQRMEDLQSRTPEMIRDVFRFLGEEIEDANFNPSRRGADSIGTRHGQKKFNDQNVCRQGELVLFFAERSALRWAIEGAP